MILSWFLSVGRWSTIERLCFIGRPDVGELLQDPELQTSARNRMQTYFSVWPRWRVMLFAFTGLLSTFLIWGYYQEKIMTLSYSGDKFTDSQFLVFMNRITAFLLSGSYLLVTHRKQPPHRAPFYKYTFASFSNTMSSWFQYEALKYVSFPTQILAKASKIIPGTVWLSNCLCTHCVRFKCSESNLGSEMVKPLKFFYWRKLIQAVFHEGSEHYQRFRMLWIVFQS